MGAPQVIISEGSLRRNFESLQGLFSGRALAPVIKANAYGHGALLIGHLLESAFAADRLPFFCVARLSEALELRRAGLRRALLVLSYFDADELALMAIEGAEDIEFAIHSAADVDLLCALAPELRRKISGLHLNINTGMNRLGFVAAGGDPAMLTKECMSIARRLVLAGFRLTGLMSHFARSEEPEVELSHEQEKLFENCLHALRQAWTPELGVFPPWVHLANSSALVNGFGVREDFNVARPGIHLWGVRHNGRQKMPTSLEPVMSVRAPLRQVFWVRAGEGIGYGHRFVPTRDTLVGTLCLGYADGISRHLSRRADETWRVGFVVKGFRVPVVGTVSMDLTMVDLTDLALARWGEQGQAQAANELVGVDAVWIGDGQSAEEIADTLGTITYDVFCSLAHRLPRKSQREILQA